MVVASRGVRILFALAVLSAVAFFVIIARSSPCRISYSAETVQGNSLSGVVEAGTHIRAERGYYACHSVSRGDFVLYRYAGDNNPLIKMALGMPGDSFALTTSGAITHILINGQPLTNADGEVYQLNAGAQKLLALYVTDYGGVIPADTYLIMGNLVGGSLDSTRFGLVDKSDIIGRAQILR